MATIQCLNPALCGVKFHRDSTVSPRCMSSKSENLLDSKSTDSLMTMTSTLDAGERIQNLEKSIQDRTDSSEFRNMLAKRDSLKLKMNDLDALIEEESDPLNKRSLKRLHKELYYQTIENRSKLESYKDETAQKYVYLLNELTTHRVEVFEGETLGKGSYRTVSAPTGSRAWLEQRQNGVGGSDIGPIIGTDGKWAERNYNNVFWSKVDPISEDDVQAQSDDNAGGPMGRGHTWEPRIIEQFQEDNPHLDVMISKDSWAIKGSKSAAINVDGLLSDTGDGVPNGILECKTSSRKEDWANGVPEGYKAQTLYYMERLGFKYGYVKVLFDDNEYAQFRLEAGDVVTTNTDSKPFNEYMEEIEAFHDLAQDYRDRGETSAPDEEEDLTPKKKQNSRFRNISPTAVNNLSAYRDEDPAITESLVQDGITQGLDAHESIVNLYHDFDPSLRKRNFAYVDLETDNGSESRGEIIEFGVTIRDGNNKIIREFDRTYSPDPRSLAVNGTGMVDVHGITVEDVQGKSMFSDPANQAEVMDLMKDTVLVTHNQSFENRHLGIGLDGYIEAEFPMVDTMHMSRYLLRGSKSNSLESFVEHYGIPYENQHRALPDAQMMAEGLYQFSQVEKD